MARRRSTRAEVFNREELQAEIVAELVKLGADKLAAQVTACWRDRLFRDPARHRYRCRSASCTSCRRPPLQAWWRSYLAWCQEGGATSYFRLVVDKPFDELPRIAKNLRNLRDRLVRESWLFGDLAFLGLTNGEYMHVLVSHPGLTREQVQRRLRAVWPKLVLEDVPATPVLELSPQVVALLGSMRRGLQPARFSVLPRQKY